MAFNYDKFADLAVRQMQAKGRNLKIRYFNKGTYDSVTNTMVGASAPVDVVVKGVVRAFSLEELNSSLVEKGDKQVLVASKGINKPKVNDFLIDGDEFKIINIKEVRPGETTVIYKLQIRR